MIYDFHTYDLKPRSVPDLERGVAEALPARLEISPLFGFWHTEAGPLNQILQVWPYDDMAQRAEARAEMKARNVWGTFGEDFVVNMQSDIYLPAPFTRPPGEAEFSPLQ